MFLAGNIVAEYRNYLSTQNFEEQKRFQEIEAKMVEVLKAIDFFMPFILLLLWYLFGMYSDTAKNHGRLIAFILPLAPFVFIVMYTLLGISKLTIYPFFVIFGKKEKYNDIVYLVKNPWLWGLK